ncbi:MAG: hypothetical protein GEU83_14625 [Pseudonocardiaceae bacterium]|nr:hypothetical protein [Pseudonocardiaceae bacterium]
MPDPDDDLETRVATLEREVARLREQAALTSSDAAAARTLAAGADHDVSEVRAELRAHTQSLNALRETQLEQGRLLAEHGRALDDHGQALAGHGQALAGHGQAIVSLDQKMSEGFATLHSGMAQITTLLQGIAGSEQD